MRRLPPASATCGKHRSAPPLDARGAAASPSRPRSHLIFARSNGNRTANEGRIARRGAAERRNGGPGDTPTTEAPSPSARRVRPRSGESYHADLTDRQDFLLDPRDSAAPTTTPRFSPRTACKRFLPRLAHVAVAATRRLVQDLAGKVPGD